MFYALYDIGYYGP